MDITTPAFAPLPCLGSIAINTELFASVLSISKVPVSGLVREREPTFACPFQVTVTVCVSPGCNVKEGTASFDPLDFQTSLNFWLAVKPSRPFTPGDVTAAFVVFVSVSEMWIGCPTL